MNFYLRNIELHIDDALIEQAESILAQQGLNKAVEIDKQLWMAKKKDHPAYEAEVQLNGKKVKDFSCDCTVYKKDQICQHITALLLDIRNQINQRESTKSKKKTKTKIPQTLTVNAILQQIRQDDLSAFVRNYARGDQKFALALKARFAGNINTEDNINKYKQLIHATLKTERTAKGYIKSTSMKTIRNFFEAIIGHAQDTISLENFSEAFAIIQAVFDKINSIFSAFEEVAPAEQIFQPFISVLYSLKEVIKAPALKEAFLEYCRRKAFEDASIKYELYEAFIDILFQSNLSRQENLQLLDLIQNTLQTASLKDKDRVNFSYFQFLLLDELALHQELNAQIGEKKEDFGTFVQLLQKLVNKKDFQLCYKIVDHIKVHELKPENQVPWLDWRLNLATSKDEREVVYDLSRKRFLQSLNFKYFEIFKSSLGRSISHEIKNLVKDLSNFPDSDQRNQAIAEIYLREKQQQKLLDHLIRVRSLKLIQKFDRELHISHQAQIWQLYQELVDEYLDNHIGHPASVTVRRLLQHLYQVNAGDLARKLAGILRKKYAWRRSLIEELEMF